MDSMTIFILVLCCSVLSELVEGRARSQEEDCVWNRDKDFPKFPSVLIDSEKWRLILPTMDSSKKKIVRVPGGSTVVIACPGGKIQAFPTKEAVSGYCSGGNTLRVDNKNYDMNELGCTKRVQESINENIYSKDSCSSGSSKTAFHSIGYSIPGYQFYEMIRVCFDHDLETAVVTSHLLQGESVTAKDDNPTRPSFKQDDGFFSVGPNNCYDQDSQKQLMADLLGNASVINIGRSQYFARGHMSPDSDFLSEETADATYHYINAVPQWQSFNNGNWKALEIAVRKLASTKGGRDFQIWTGPLGILKLDDSKGKAQKIYLGLVEQKKVIPVPEITWKVIYEKSSNRGIAVIGLNNPFLTKFPQKLCPDICDQIPWIKFDINKFTQGGIYCCDVQSFRRAVPSLPNLGRVQLLDG